MLTVYVAAPYARAPEVRAVHDELHGIGCQPTSHWARLARGLDLCVEMSPGELASANELNDRGIEAAVALLALTFEGEGGEMFCEVERARAQGCPVLWTGPRFIPTCAREGVYVCSRAVALDALARAARRQSEWGSSVATARTRAHRCLCLAWPIVSSTARETKETKERGDRHA